MPLPLYNPFTSYKSTSKLRTIRDAGLAAIVKPDKYCMIDSATIHFFKDCCLVFGGYKQGILSCKEGEMLSKSFAAYTKDFKVWKPYTDQFEPAEGFHKAYEYKPHDASFPTNQW